MRNTTRRIALALTGALTAAVALTATATPASAVTVSSDKATLTSADVVVVPAGTCVAHPIDYSVNVPAGTETWGLDVWVYNEAGGLADSMMLRSSSSAPAGTGTVQFCDYSDQPGLYTFTPELDYRLGGIAYNNVTVPQFQVRVIGNVTTGTSIKAKRKGANVTVTTKVTVKSGAVTAPVVGGTVAVQKKVGRKWKTVKSGVTTATGAAKIKVKAKRGTILRAQFAGLGEYTAVGAGVPIPASTSKSVRIR